MPDVYFTTNPSEWLKLEGLYVSERNPPGFIRGRDLGVVGFAGRCVRGPTTPLEITSSGRFLEVYGGRDYGSGGSLIGQVWAALLNKPFGGIVVRRVVASDAVKATKNLANAVPTNIVRVDASSLGAWGNNVTVAVETATDADANHFNLRIAYLGQEVVYENLNCTTGNDNLAAAVGSDEGRFVDLTKLADGRPINAVAAALTTGAEGTLAAGDYNSGMNEIAVYPGVSICLTPENPVTPATFHSNIVTLAAAVSDRIFLVWSGTPGQSVSTEIAAVAAQITTRSDRIVWCYNAPYTIDPETDSELATGPHVWLASILSQNDADVHPGAVDTAPQTAGIKRLSNVTLSRADLISLKNAGISTLERLPGLFLFRSGVTTLLTAGKTEITRRRMTDFLQLSASDRLRFYVKAKNTPEVRAQMAAELTAFSQQLKDENRYIEDFAIDQESVNTANARAQGLEKLLWRVRLIGHILSLVMETEIGTGVTIEAA